jgi:hypothetical protein
VRLPLQSHRGCCSPAGVSPQGPASRATAPRSRAGLCACLARRLAVVGRERPSRAVRLHSGPKDIAVKGIDCDSMVCLASRSLHLTRAPRSRPPPCRTDAALASTWAGASLHLRPAAKEAGLALPGVAAVGELAQHGCRHPPWLGIGGHTRASRLRLAAPSAARQPATLPATRTRRLATLQQGSLGGQHAACVWCMPCTRRGARFSPA